jgi:hypothetical protein
LRIRNYIFPPKKYIAFFGITSVVLITSLVKVPCPVCEGTGIVSRAVGMDKVFLFDFNASLQFSNPDFCMGYSTYEYGIDMSLTNSGTEKASGWIKLVLKNVSEGYPLDIRHVPVEIEQGSTVKSHFTTWFMTTYSVSQNVTVDATIELFGVEDRMCSGTGSLPLNLSFVARTIKSSLLRTIRTEQTFTPPPYEIPHEYNWD